MLGGDGRKFTEQGRTATKKDGWNHVRVAAVGNRFQTWLNGVQRVDAKDYLTPAGFIALQVHAVGGDKKKEGMEVRWRDLRLTPMGGGVAPANELSALEREQGWKLLWDGKGGDGWQSIKGNTFPVKGWTMTNGELTVLGKGGGDIVTTAKYSNFVLKADFRVTPGANGGIKYFIDPDATGAANASVGFEYQVLDDAKHPDATKGRDGNHSLASLYDLFPAAKTKQPNPVGEWNTAMIVVDGNKVSHWLNGVEVVSIDRGSDAFRAALAASKFKGVAKFGALPGGHILLQDHGNTVSFRNIKIRELN